MSGRAGMPDTLDRLRIGAPSVAPEAGDLSVESDISAGGNLTVGGSVTASGNQTINGNLTVAGTLGVTGATTLAGQLNAGAGAIFTGDVVGNNGLILSGEPTPRLQTVAFGKEVDVRAPGAGRGMIAVPGGKNLSSEAWLKFYSGTTPYWVPAFSSLYSGA